VRERVILVDRADRPVGTAEKLAAHRSGSLHRAFSVLVRDGDGRVLLQRRALDKYHSPGLWSNTCCSHPRPGEPTIAAAHRRLVEEMGFDCPLRPVGSLLYRARVGAGLVEHEYDHVLVGHWEGTPVPDPAEVADWRWADLPDLGRAVRWNSSLFTPWFRLLLPRLEALLRAEDRRGCARRSARV
jgi:isopentenyl-diphosphate Delta-isomerase